MSKYQNNSDFKYSRNSSYGDNNWDNYRCGGSNNSGDYNYLRLIYQLQRQIQAQLQAQLQLQAQEIYSNHKIYIYTF